MADQNPPLMPLPLPESKAALEFLRDELDRVIRPRDVAIANSRRQHILLEERLAAAKLGPKAKLWYEAAPPPAIDGFDFETPIPEEVFWYLSWTIQQSNELRENLSEVTNKIIPLLPLNLDDHQQMEQFLALNEQRLAAISFSMLPYRVLRMKVLYKLGGQEAIDIDPAQMDGQIAAASEARAQAALKLPVGYRPALARNQLWLKWATDEQLTPARIRDRWNKLSNEERCKLAGSKAKQIEKGKTGYDVVKKGLKAARNIPANGKTADSP